MIRAADTFAMLWEAVLVTAPPSAINIPASVASASSLPVESFVFFSPAAAKLFKISGAVKKFILSLSSQRSEQAQDPPVLINIDLFCGRNLRKARHGHNIPG